MNYTAIAIAMGRERDLVEGCIREILQALSRVISYREPVQFLFYNIGYSGGENLNKRPDLKEKATI